MTETLELEIAEPYKDMLDNMDEEDNDEITLKDQLTNRVEAIIHETYQQRKL